MCSVSKYSTVIFDIGDVLFSWSAQTTTSISPRTLKSIISSPTWFDYERGLITQTVCYDRIGKEFSIDPAEVGRAFDQARDSLQPNDEVISFIRELKSQSSGLRVFAMSNISLPDYEVLRTKPADWDIFDDIFASAIVGERKPNLGFYKHVLTKTGTDPSNAIFVDDKLENVLSARSLGLHGIVFDNSAKVMRALRNLLGNPVDRGRNFLEQNAGLLDSVTDSGVALKENFAQLLIFEVTNDRHLVTFTDQPRTWNFWQGTPLLTTREFPFDLDTTSIALTITHPEKDVIASVMDEMLQYIDADGIIQTYFDHKRPRFDPVVCLNVLTLFYANGRGSDLAQTLQWVHEVLLHRAYLDGTRYYATAECFLFFASRLLDSSNDVDLHSLLKSLLKERVQERIGAEGDALALAMRIMTCASVGVRDEVDLRALLPLQLENGDWGTGWIYKYGESGMKIGNRGLTTAFAISAIQAVDRMPASRPSSPSTITTLSSTESVISTPSSESLTAKIAAAFRLMSPAFKGYFTTRVTPPTNRDQSPSPSVDSRMSAPFPNHARKRSSISSIFPWRDRSPSPSVDSRMSAPFTRHTRKRSSISIKFPWRWHGREIGRPLEAEF